VIQLLRRIWQLEPCPTVGIVTFNAKQQDLIENLIQEDAIRDSNFRLRYESESAREEGDRQVGLFVKNLESVQGDERDVIIFSTTFGRDNTGTFKRFFGPLNLEGGEKRLNVAVTRAKKKVSSPGASIRRARSRESTATQFRVMASCGLLTAASPLLILLGPSTRLPITSAHRGRSRDTTTTLMACLTASCAMRTALSPRSTLRAQAQCPARARSLQATARRGRSLGYMSTPVACITVSSEYRRHAPRLFAIRFDDSTDAIQALIPTR
jgi:hypothetical protein